METYLKNLALQLDIDLSENEVEQFLRYQEILLETNRYFNLTAIVEEKEVILKHFIDSLTIEKYLENSKKMIDVGTGAGFPGVPIKIVREDIQVTLLDSLNKRLNFLNTVIDTLSLKNITTVHGRAEDVARQKDYREKYDYVTARAVANLSTLSELCLPFLCVGGKFICMKGAITDELDNAKNAITLLGGKVEKIDHFYLPGSDIERNIILIQKVKNTPAIYPRKAGTPAKEPLR